ncbi:hypothetical protein F3Y22_tig00000340pilonHSYRG00999 [Hibiscus syriacus]|uniref:RNase H type-1 domain-containing protein n=1 Tax=Hibiscus syriacus TaxID=106335 RepID=A0A6A3D2E5_HIBSY|nr:uncharacterized protein LOC120199533 [Hibiscus syriacus]KAE8735646.1 hypothetical protein F3Y22_tig00000340pilonHSYRG00999 [Hibiscus syriacus]
MEDVLQLSLAWSSHFVSTRSVFDTPITRTMTAITWQPPPDKGFYLNTDAAVDSISSLGSASGVVRSSEGVWMTGFHKSVGITSPLQVELWAIYIGLQVALHYSVELLQIQSDSIQAIQLLNNPTSASASLPLVRAISSLRWRRWYTDFLWTPREGNMVTDGMA